MSDLQHTADDAANAIDAWVTSIFADLGHMARETEHAMRDMYRRRDELTEKHLRAVRPMASAFLERHEVPEAAGVVIGPGVIDPERGAVEWWRRDEDGTTKRIVFTLTPDAAGYYDFVSLDWFSDVIATGKPAVQGPYLDYAGMDQYIMTFMVPFSLDGELVGTAGCDIEVRELEKVIMPILRTIPADAALVSRLDRTIVGNSGRFLVGNRVGDLPDGGIRIDIPAEGLGLSLVVAEPEFAF